MKFIVNRSKWRCGGNLDEDHENIKAVKGLGYTQMANDKGFMCCLGHCYLQLHKNLTIDDMKGLAFPEDVAINMSFEEGDIFATKVIDEEVTYHSNTDLSSKAASINDHDLYNQKERESKLKQLFKEHGHSIKFVGKTVKWKPND